MAARPEKGHADMLQHPGRWHACHHNCMDDLLPLTQSKRDVQQRTIAMHFHRWPRFPSAPPVPSVIHSLQPLSLIRMSRRAVLPAVHGPSKRGSRRKHVLNLAQPYTLLLRARHLNPHRHGQSGFSYLRCAPYANFSSHAAYLKPRHQCEQLCKEQRMQGCAATCAVANMPYNEGPLEGI